MSSQRIDVSLAQSFMSTKKKVSTFANKIFAKGCVLFKNLWLHDEDANKEKKLEYFKEWDNKMRS